ncbi:MAG: hypothetical protein MSH10_08515 [Pygmaiobacter massiliensis]|nr:hypothetical protein [Pygmaiobacter massiliensis]
MPKQTLSGWVKTAKRVKLSVAALGFCISILLSVRCGGSLWQGIAFWALAAVCLYLPGKPAARLFGLEGFGGALITLLFGCGSFAAITCVAARFGAGWLLWLSPAAGVGYALWQAKRSKKTGEILVAQAKNRVSALCADGYFCTLAALWGILCVVWALAICVPNGFPSALGHATAPSQDLLWNVGNAKSFALGFPPQDLRFSQVRFSYHYLTELIFGGLCLMSGLDAYQLIAFFAGPLVLAALLSALWCLGQFFYRGSKNRSLAFILLLFGCGCASGLFAFKTGPQGLFGNSNFYHLTTNINAQASIIIFLCGFLVLFGQLARDKFRAGPRKFAALFCSFLLCCFAKGPAAAIVLCSALITIAIVLVFQKPCRVRAAFAGAGLLVVFLACWSFLFSAGANSSMTFGVKTVQDLLIFPYLASISDRFHLSYFGMALICLIQWFLMQPVQFLLVARGIFRDVRSLVALPAERLVANGAMAGGMLAYFLFWHPSYSQVYFALLAFFFSSLLAAGNLALPAFGWAKKLLAVLAAWALLTNCAIAAGLAANAIDLLQAQQISSPAACVTLQDEKAMAWLKENTSQDAVFATNRIDTYPGAGNGISNIYTAWSGRQAYLEGYTYALTNMGVSQPVLEEKLSVNGALFSDQTPPEQMRQLCEENGIDYLVFCERFAGSKESLCAFACVYEQGDVSIWKVE